MYASGHVDIFDMVDIDLFTVIALNMMVLKLGYTGKSELMFYNYLKPLTSLDEGLYALACEEDVRCMGTLVRSFKLIGAYIEHGVTALDSYLRAPRFRATLEEITDELPVSEEPNVGRTQEPILSEVSTQEPIVAEVSNDAPIVEEVETQELSVEDVVVEDYVSSKEDGEDAEQGNGQEDESAPTDGQFFYDDEGIDIAYETEYDVQYSEDAGTDDDNDVDEDFLVDEENKIVKPDVDVYLFGINMDLPFDNIGITNLVSDAVLEGEDVDVSNADGFDSGPVEVLILHWQEIYYYKKAKDRVYLHSIKNKRNLKLYKNDGVMIRARCDGKKPVFTMSQGTGPTGPNRGMEAGASRSSGPTTRSKKRRIQTHNDTQTRLQSREIKHRNNKFSSEKIFKQVRINLDILVKVVQDHLQHELEVQISMSKAFRAKAKAEKERGDHVLQYSMLRDYVVELQSTNPNITVKIAVERNTDPFFPTRVFQRIYICLGALKLGFRACRRDLLGLDGAFMKGPFPGQVLVAVGLDSNNGIYPLAYPLAEAEVRVHGAGSCSVWGWCGQAYKNLLWRAASTIDVKDFEKCRAKSDLLLNNICTAFNGKIVEGRDKQVITLLEYIKEYCMKRIVNVQGVIDKCTGPLTPTATRIMKSIKKEAHLMKVQWNGANKYQVLGPLACWNMALNDRATPPPENWVNPCYWLTTWKETYSHKIQPIYGTKYWEKSICPTTLLPTKHHVQERMNHYMQSCGNTGHNKATCKGQVGQDGLGGSGARVVIGLSAATGEGGASVASEDGREMGDGIPTQSSAAGGASEWSFLRKDENVMKYQIRSYDKRLFKPLLYITDSSPPSRVSTKLWSLAVEQYQQDLKNVCEEEVPLNNNIGKQIGDFVDMPSEAVKQRMDANVPDEIDGAKGEQVPNHVVKKSNLEFLVCKEVANPSVNELVDNERPLKRKMVYAE
uniref:Uncharacterized protein n=1 Tax=Tanacetum cinerariifolium TaxID=118510 RepID=A0A699H601_TANCI|nr:hypothetical protein [Tanacetum cinerariifolium]